jgi:hypothetical protein
MVEVDLDRTGACGEDERLGELLLADHAEDRRDGVARVRVVRAPEIVDVRRGEAAQHPVDELRGKRAAPGVLAPLAEARGDVGAVRDGFDQLREVRRLVLQVSVHRDDDVAPRADEPCVHRRMLPEIPLEAHRLDARVPRVEALDRRPRAVARAVVDDDHLERTRIGLENGHRLRHDLLDGSFLVEDGHDQRDIRTIVLRKIG